MKKNNYFLILLLIGIGCISGCVPFIQNTNSHVHHADPFYNIDDIDNDYPLLHLPLIKPIEANRIDGKTPWRIFINYGLFVSIPNSQKDYSYNIEEMEKFSVKNNIIMAYSPYINQKADVYIQNNFYHWFVIIPASETVKGFHSEDEFNDYIQWLDIKDPIWNSPDEAYEIFSQTGCLKWIQDCN